MSGLDGWVEDLGRHHDDPDDAENCLDDSNHLNISGLKQMISFVSKDKELLKKIKKESPANIAPHHHY